VGDGIAAGTLDKPLTVTAGFVVTVVLAEELVDDVLLVLVLFAMDIVGAAEELMEDAMVAVVVVAPVEPPDDPFDPPWEPLPAPPPVTPVGLFNVKVHFFTSCTSDIPLTVTGVKVILHISVAGPIEVFVCVTVVTVVGSEIKSTFGR